MTFKITTLFVTLCLFLTLTFPMKAAAPWLDDTIVVDPKNYLSYKFWSPTNQEVVKINGSFRARGGQRNDIIVLVMDEDGFENWRNGNRADFYYNSGQVTVGKVNLTLKPGNYYLVFSNSFSIFSNKSVKITFDLE